MKFCSNYLRTLCLLLLGSLLIGCPSYDPSSGSVEILNYTDSAIYVYATCSNTFPGPEPELKLFLSAKSNSTDACQQRMRDTIAPNYRVNAYSWGTLRVGGTSDNPAIACGNKTLTFYCIKEVTMRAYDWKTICRMRLYQKKIALTEEQLAKSCWRVMYDNKSRP